MNHTAHYAILAALLFAGSAVLAADSTKDKAETRTITLKNGKVLQDAYILDKKPNGVTFGYKEGAAFVRYSDMPTAAQNISTMTRKRPQTTKKRSMPRKRPTKKRQSSRRPRSRSRSPNGTNATGKGRSASRSRKSASSNLSLKKQRSNLVTRRILSVRTAARSCPRSTTIRFPSTTPGASVPRPVRTTRPSETNS